jgi:hypothetical protein
MKYIVIRRTWRTFVQECPIIFPEEFTHPQMFEAIKGGIEDMEDAVIVSAGFVDIMTMLNCHGVSGGLKLASRGSVDSSRIREYINDRGVVGFDHEAQA